MKKLFDKKNDVPVLIVMFNRPEKVKKLISVLRKVKPKNIYVAADGPRKNVPEDLQKTKLCKSIIESIDWKCNINRNYYSKNMGVNSSMEKSITWFFDNNEAGIILEDDCIPNIYFFSFAKMLLNKYRYNHNIMMISGSNFNKNINSIYSYRFSRLPIIWGWATWKRSWSKYKYNESEMDNYIKTKKLEKIYDNKKIVKFWKDNLKKRYIDNAGNKRVVWDAYWNYVILKNKGICIIPNKNLIKNIGYGHDSTHTGGSGRGWSLEQQKIDSIIHPPKIRVDTEQDNQYFYKRLHKNFFDKVYNKINVFLDYIGLKPIILKILKK